jgi:hypothetical protein
MKPSARLFTGWAVLALGWSVLAAGPARADDVAAQVYPRGIHAFLKMLDEVFHLKPVTEVGELNQAPGRTLLIVFGDLRGLTMVPGGVQRFLDRGGAVLVASDFGNDPAGTAVLEQIAHVRPDGAIVVNDDPALNYGGEQKCPLVTHLAADHPLFKGVNKLATNEPSFLQWGEETRLHPLAAFPLGSRILDGRWLAREHRVFAVGNEGPSGQVLVLAGHGVFMNGTMGATGQPPYDAQNFRFAFNCIRWFTRSPKRDRVLLIHDGQVISTFQVPLLEIPFADFTLQDVNDALRSLQDEPGNFFSRVLLSLVDPHGDEDNYATARHWLNRWALLLLGLGVLVFGLYRLWRARYRRELTVPLVANHLAHTVPTDPVVAQRQRDMLREGNFWEAARELARQCFAGYAARAAHFPPPPPQVAARASRGRGRVLARQVQRLWHLGFISPPRPVSRAEFARLADDVDEIKAALASGRLALEPPAGPPIPLPRRPGTVPAATP